MNLSERPTGEEREVRFLGGAAIDGAPVAYIIVLAAVVAALGVIPFSVILGSGGSFPMSQSIFPLVGWVLGPIAGAVATGIGRLVGGFLFPHTAGPVPWASIWGAAIASFAAGSMVLGKRRKGWWIALSVLFIVEFLLYVGRAILVNGVDLRVAILTSFVDWSSIVLYLLPTRTLAVRWIGSRDSRRVAAGLFLGTWMIAGISLLSVSTILYQMFNWPEADWIRLIPVIPVEHVIRCLVGAVIGTGVIAGLRAIGLVKPTEATY